MRSVDEHRYDAVVNHLIHDASVNETGYTPPSMGLHGYEVRADRGFENGLGWFRGNE
jgi:hypothetical protein